MTQVPMTLTFGQAQKSRSNFPKKWVKKNKNKRTGHISEAISHTDFIISIITAFCDSFGRCWAYGDSKYAIKNGGNRA